MDATTKKLVRQRAGDCCEYCHLPQDATPFITFHIEHVIAKQHTPDDDNLNDLKRLGIACDRCNLFKGPNLSSIDPNSGEIVNLFNPRTDNWNDHFAVLGAKDYWANSNGPRDCKATQHERPSSGRPPRTMAR
jgi:hypothetical protein